jgi:hypothetical protein
VAGSSLESVVHTDVQIPHVAALSLSDPTAVSPPPLVCLAYSDANALAAVDMSGHFGLYDFRAASCLVARHALAHPRSIAGPARAVAATLRGPHSLTVITAAGTLAVVDLRCPLHHVYHSLGAPVPQDDPRAARMALAADMQMYVSGHVDSAVVEMFQLPDVNTPSASEPLRPVFSHQGHTFGGMRVTAIAAHPHLPLVVSADRAGELHAWRRSPT